MVLAAITVTAGRSGLTFRRMAGGAWTAVFGFFIKAAIMGLNIWYFLHSWFADGA